jgi:hypothetical protein
VQTSCFPFVLKEKRKREQNNQNEWTFSSENHSKIISVKEIVMHSHYDYIKTSFISFDTILSCFFIVSNKSHTSYSTFISFYYHFYEKSHSFGITQKKTNNGSSKNDSAEEKKRKKKKSFLRPAEKIDEFFQYSLGFFDYFTKYLHNFLIILKSYNF